MGLYESANTILREISLVDKVAPIGKFQQEN